MEKLSVIMHAIFYNAPILHGFRIRPGVTLVEIKDFQVLKIELAAISVVHHSKSSPSVLRE